MKRQYWYIFAAIVLLGLQACEDDGSGDVDFKYDYYPLEEGQYVTYQVDSITYDDFFDPPKVDTLSIQVKERLDTTFLDNEGRLAYRLERFERADAQAPWVLKDVWYTLATATTAEKVEENLRFIKFIFPPRVDETWNGNIYINITPEIEFLEDWEYRITEVDMPKTINGNTFDSTTTVLQQDFETLIDRTYSLETYAKGVGLVYKELQVLETTQISQSTPWAEKATSGFIMRQRVIDHGIE